MPDQPTASAAPLAAADCEHHYASRLLGGHPIAVRACTLCGKPDWDDLADQAMQLYQWGRDEALAGKPSRTSLSAYDMPRLVQVRKELSALAGNRSTSNDAPKKLGTVPWCDGTADLYGQPRPDVILEVVFDWIEENETRAPSLTGGLLHKLRELGYCACTTEFGCVVCGGTKKEIEGPIREQRERPTHPDGTPYQYHEIVAEGWGHCDGCRLWSTGTVARPHQCAQQPTQGGV